MDRIGEKSAQIKKRTSRRRRRGGAEQGLPTNQASDMGSLGDDQSGRSSQVPQPTCFPKSGGDPVQGEVHILFNAFDAQGGRGVANDLVGIPDEKDV